jgi:hypothetical protein
MLRAWTRFTLGLASLVLLTSGAAADDWVATKLRGPVLQLENGEWQPLNRGDVVPDERPIRTLATGHVTFVRGGETVDLGPNTLIQIHDKAGAKPFTTVTQYFGQVTVEAEVQNVQHFAVQTPYLAAVVKGTRFVVTSGKTFASVTVRRGHVAVEDKANRQHVTIGVGQSAAATSGKNDTLAVTGSGTLPVVLAADNQPVVAAPTGPHAVTPKAKKDGGPITSAAVKSEPKANDEDAPPAKHKDTDDSDKRVKAGGGSDKPKPEKSNDGLGQGSSGLSGGSGGGKKGDENASSGPGGSSGSGNGDQGPSHEAPRKDKGGKGKK